MIASLLLTIIAMVVYFVPLLLISRWIDSARDDIKKRIDELESKLKIRDVSLS